MVKQFVSRGRQNGGYMSGAVVDARAEASVGKTPVDLRQVGAHPDYWYPVAWSHEVKRGQVVASSFAGEPIAIVRPQQGELYALEDRRAQIALKDTHVIEGFIRAIGPMVGRSETDIPGPLHGSAAWHSC